MTSITAKDLNNIFQMMPSFISNTWRDLPECFKLCFETHYGRLIDVISDSNICSMGRECLYFSACWEDYALIGYQPSQCLAPSELKIVFLRKGPCSTIQIEEISLCTAKEFLNFLIEIYEKRNASDATEEDKNSLSHISEIKLNTCDGARWYFEIYKDIAYQKSHHPGEFFNKDLSQDKSELSKMQIVLFSFMAALFVCLILALLESFRK
jgi:hypothetical protein